MEDPVANLRKLASRCHRIILNVDCLQHFAYGALDYKFACLALLGVFQSGVLNFSICCHFEKTSSNAVTLLQALLIISQFLILNTVR